MSEVRGFINIANRAAVNLRDELNGKVLTRPALLITDGDSVTYGVDVDIGSGVDGGLKSQGDWDASTNDPPIPAAARENDGHYYRVIVAGNTTVSGLSNWIVGDWIVSNGKAWLKLGNLTETLRNVPLARANADLMYADVGNPVRLRRTVSGQYEVVGFSKEMPGTYTRVAVDIEDYTFGIVEDLTIQARPLTYDELVDYGYGVVPYGAIALFKGGLLVGIN
jgi:hypothetical protein